MLSNTTKLDKIENKTRNLTFYFKSPVKTAVTTIYFTSYYVIGTYPDLITLNGKEIKWDSSSKNNLYASGLLHKEDGPAYIDKFIEVWYIDDKHHRDNGPAVCRSNGELAWWKHGVRLSVDKERLLNIWYKNQKVKQQC